MPHGAKNENDHDHNISFSEVPNTCSVCNHKITPQQVGMFINTKKHHTQPDEELQIVYRCANKDCKAVFIAYYRAVPSNPAAFTFVKTKPVNFQTITFSQTIKSISPDFEKIYNESAQAEKLSLLNICGPGYRKALEFLVKDYLLNKTEKPDDKEKIKKEMLGPCIEKRIKDPSIKAVAKRAAWLGNDETHYIRKWEDKDLQDLKKLIDLTVHWMEAEALTNDLLNDMPE